MSAMRWAAAGICGAAAALAGCNTGREAMQARLEVSAASCAADINLAAAQPFPAASNQKYMQTIRFTEASLCVNDAAGKKAVYAVLAIPADDGAGIITVSSHAMGETVFSPRLQLRDDRGTITREVARDAFLYNGAAVEAQLRERPGERYLVIMSDNASVGQSVQQIQSQRTSTAVAAGPVIVSVHTGSEQTSRLIFAHNGEVTVTVEPMPKAK
jgi:hypothetical protein